jgi:hypothetical protein
MRKEPQQPINRLMFSFLYDMFYDYQYIVPIDTIFFFDESIYTNTKLAVKAAY